MAVAVVAVVASTARRLQRLAARRAVRALVGELPELAPEEAYAEKPTAAHEGGDK